MNKITIRTACYNKELNKFLQNAKKNNLCTVDKNSPQRATLTWQNNTTVAVVHTILQLLYSVAVLQNPVYKFSPKLRELSAGLRRGSLHERNARDLSAFLLHNSDLNVDSYVTFRMVEYKHKLDLLLYLVAKKINFYQL